MDKKRGLEFIMAVLILAGAYYIGHLGAEMTQMHRKINEMEPIVDCMDLVETDIYIMETEQQDEETEMGNEVQGVKVEGKVMIDAGHGGIDSGKVGINGALEKDINLQIAEKLKVLLLQAGIEVKMSREEDIGLYDDSETNKKQQDMKRRVEKIEKSGADLAVSIHQNSYTEESIKGPQIFYYETSAKGEHLAEILQESLNKDLEIRKPREKKANDTYYVLKKTPIPTVIVECGFLSNLEEAELLMTDDYQEKVAKALYNGILMYLKEEKHLLL